VRLLKATAKTRRTQRVAKVSVKTLKLVCQITKLPITALSTVSAVTGYVLMRRVLDPGVATVCAGVLLLAMGACALNQVQDRRIDGLMERTRSRPLPSGLLRPAAALGLGLGLIVSGFLVLWLCHSALAALIGIFAAVWYNGVYTYLKRVSAFAVVPGALIGALPPAIGWVAAGGSPTDPRLIALCFLFFIWQVPHFWLLLFTFGPDYANAGLPSLTRIFSLRQLAGLSFIWMLAASASVLLLPLYGLTSSAWVSLGLVLCGFWLAGAASNLLRPTPRPAFRAINLYVLCVMALLVTDALL